MTFLEAKNMLQKKYFSNCNTAEDCQQVVGQYAIDSFGEKNAQRCINKLKKIQAKYQRHNPKPTPQIISAIFYDFGTFVRGHKYNTDPNYNPAEMYIMTVIAAEISEKLEK